MNLKINTILKSVFFLALFAFAVNVGAVWMSPSSSAPGNNTKPPVNEGTFTQFKNGSFTALGLKATTAAILEGSLQIPGGIPPLDGKVLTSDATGMASWQTFTGGDGGNVDNNNIDGTTNYVTKWTGPHTIGNSQIFDNATFVGVGTNTPVSGVKLDVNGKLKNIAFQMNVGTQPLTDKVLTTDVFGNGTWQVPGGCGTPGGWTKSGNVVRLTTQNDKVGIGFVDCPTTSTQQLEITKNFKIPLTTVNGVAGTFYGKTSNGTEYRWFHTFGGSNSNIYIGRNAGNFTSGAQNASNNIGIGAGVLSNITTSNNVVLGANVSTSGNRNVGLGTTSIVGDDNVISSYQSGGINGNGNVLLGNQQQGIGNNNVSVGEGSIIDVIGSNNTFIGRYASPANTNGIDNATAIGAHTQVVASNTMSLGTAYSVNEHGDVNHYIEGWGFGIQPGENAITVGTNSTNGNGAHLTKQGQWEDSSDINKKHNIQDISYGLDEVMKLRPVSFDWNGTNTHDIGFIAQEVKEIIPEVVSGEEGNMTMSYSAINSVLAKALQELKEENDLLKYETSLLEKELE